MQKGKGGLPLIPQTAVIGRDTVKIRFCIFGQLGFLGSNSRLQISAQVETNKRPSRLQILAIVSPVLSSPSPAAPPIRTITSLFAIIGRVL